MGARLRDIALEHGIPDDQLRDGGSALEIQDGGQWQRLSSVRELLEWLNYDEYQVVCYLGGDR